MAVLATAQASCASGSPSTDASMQDGRPPFLAVSLTLMFLLCLFYSHRVGGPTRKIAESLHLMAAGDLWVNVKLRDSDLLQDVAHSVNLTTSSWRKTVREIEWIAVSLKDRAGDDPLLARHVADLEAIVNRYKTTREG